MSQSAPHIPPYYNSAPPAALPPRRSFGSLFGWVLFLGLSVILFLLMSRRGTVAPRAAAIPLSEFAERLENNEIRSVVVTHSEIRGEFAEAPVASSTRPAGPDRGGQFTTALPGGLGENWGFVEWLLAHRGDAVVTAQRDNNDNNYVYNIFLPLVPWLLIFAMIWFVVVRPLRNSR